MVDVFVTVSSSLGIKLLKATFYIILHTSFQSPDSLRVNALCVSVCICVSTGARDETMQTITKLKYEVRLVINNKTFFQQALNLWLRPHFFTGHLWQLMIYYTTM